MIERSALLISILCVVLLSHPVAMAMQYPLQEGEQVSPEAFEGRILDCFTQKGGKGNSVPSPPFGLGELITLYANLTYNGWPVQTKDVLLQIDDPFSNTFFISGKTNASGIATASLRLPGIDCAKETMGNWTIQASADVREVYVVDTISFCAHWILADVNQDLIVDILDVAKITASYHATPSDPNWNLNADIAPLYGVIDVFDVVVCLGAYGQKYPKT